MSTYLEGIILIKDWRGFAARLSKSKANRWPSVFAPSRAVIRRTIATFCGSILCLLSACGGGGSAGPDQSANAVCAPKVVTIQLFGDSVQYAQGDRLQRYMNERFGSGAVLVTNLGISGSITAEMDLAKALPGSITVANYGINDWKRGVSADDYKAALRRINVSVYETPSPPWDGYAYAMREVAASDGKPLIDVSAFVRSLPNWGAHVPDGVHPDEWLLDKIVSEKVGPEMAAIVAPMVCK